MHLRFLAFGVVPQPVSSASCAFPDFVRFLPLRLSVESSDPGELKELKSLPPSEEELELIALRNLGADLVPGRGRQELT